MIAAHQAYRCSCDVVVDAFCGAGGNAIQLANTCHYGKLNVGLVTYRRNRKYRDRKKAHESLSN